MTDCDDAVTEVSDNISQLSWLLLLLHHNHDDDELMISVAWISREY